MPKLDLTKLNYPDVNLKQRPKIVKILIYIRNPYGTLTKKFYRVDTSSAHAASLYRTEANRIYPPE